MRRILTFLSLLAVCYLLPTPSVMPVAHAQQQLIYCQKGVTNIACNSTTGPINTGNGDYPYQAFGKLNAMLAQIYSMYGTLSNFYVNGVPLATDIASLWIGCNATTPALGYQGTCITGGGSGGTPGGTTGQLQYNNSGAFGGISNVSGGVLLGQTAGAPIFEVMSGDCAITASGAITCTKSSGAQIVTQSGSWTVGHCPEIESTSGALEDSGSPCGGGGSGTVNSGAAGDIGCYVSSGTAISGCTAQAAIGYLNAGSPVVETSSYTPTTTANANGEYDMDCSSACTFTLPAASSVAYATGTTLTIAATGAGNVAIALAAGVSVVSPGTLSYAEIGPSGGLIQLQLTATSNTWRQLFLQSGYATFTVSGCDATGATGGNTGGVFTMGEAGPCTLTVTPGGALTAKSAWTASIFDRTQDTIPMLGATSSSSTTATFSVPTQYADSDSVQIILQPQ